MHTDLGDAGIAGVRVSREAVRAIAADLLEIVRAVVGVGTSVACRPRLRRRSRSAAGRTAADLRRGRGRVATQLDRFARYHEAWRGALAMLRALLEDHDVPRRLLAQAMDRVC